MIFKIINILTIAYSIVRDVRLGDYHYNKYKINLQEPPPPPTPTPEKTNQQNTHKTKKLLNKITKGTKTNCF